MRKIAVLLPGAGSSADFVRRAFGGPLAAAGYDLLAVPPVPGPGLVAAAYAALDAAAATHGPRLRLVGGVSLGAHVATRWAARTGTRAGVLAALPAWTGAPGPVAAATASSAALVDRLGTAAALERAAAGAGAVPWIAAELTAAWPGYGPALADSLRAAAAAPGPDPAELAGLRVPVGLVAFVDDPLHPLGVAQEWARALPRAGMARLRLADLATDRTVLGAAALAALPDDAEVGP